MQNPFTAHPHSINESYFQHLKFALKFGFTLLLAGFACITHAVLPFLFKTTGSDLLFKMTDKINNRKLNESIEKKIHTTFVS